MKTIVTHLSPDLDALTAVWLIKRFMPGWKDADLKFVPAGKSLNDLPPDQNPDLIHVDTGLGRFDHHQSGAKTCATEKVLEHLIQKSFIVKKLIKPLRVLSEFVIEEDHFLMVNYPDPESIRYEFLLNNLIRGLKIVLVQDFKLAEFSFTLLDGTLEKLKTRIAAEEELDKGVVFNSYIGRSLGIESGNDEVLRFAQQKGYVLAVRKDPKFGNIRIKCLPDDRFDLTPIYSKLLLRDKVGFWYLHPSKHMLLNGSAKRPDQTPSPLTISQIIAIIKSV